MKEKFYEYINKIPQKANSYQMSSAKYFKLMNEVKVAKSGTNKENRHYWLLRHYDVINVNNEDKLVAPRVKDQVLYYAVLEELFDIMYETHTSIGHGGRDKMKNKLQQKYKNITLQEIQTFLNLCEPCMNKRNGKKSINMLHFNTRCQVDLIDFESKADGEFKFILVYRDDLTKFMILRALKSKEAVEVAEELLSIFLLFGAPTILQSYDGREFVNKIIESFKQMWPDLKIIYGNNQYRNNQSQFNDDNPNQDIKNILNARMKQEKSNNWSKMLGFVQFTNNGLYHIGIKRSPCDAMFGRPLKVGLDSSLLPSDVIEDINTEDDLEKVLQESENKKNAFQKGKLSENINQEHNVAENLLLKDSSQEDIMLAEELVTKQESIDNLMQNYIPKDEKELKLENHCKACNVSFIFLNNTDICQLCSLHMKIKSSRKESEENLENQAKRIKIAFDSSHS